MRGTNPALGLCLEEKGKAVEQRERADEDDSFFLHLNYQGFEVWSNPEGNKGVCSLIQHYSSFSQAGLRTLTYFI